MEAKKHKLLFLLIGALFLSLLNGCSVKHAVNQPQKKNFDILKAGIERDWVHTEFGEPIPSVVGDNCETYSFIEGSSGWKYLRAFFYSLFDIGSLGLMEIIFYPIESSVGNDKIRLRTCYDEQDKVVRVEKFQGKEGMKVLVDSPIQPPGQTTETIPPVILINSETTRSIEMVGRGDKVTISGQVKDDSKISQVLVNGNQAYFDEYGNFSHDVILSSGRNLIRIEATDIFQNRGTQEIVINVE